MKRSKKIAIQIIIYLLLLVINAYGQDISTLKNQKPFKINGGFRLGTSYYNTQNRNNFRNPFAYIISGHTTVSIYGIRFPFSISLHDNKFDFSRPHNRFSLKPRYKWIKAYLGHSNMSFSPYSLAGHTFWGAGVDLSPGKLRFSAMYGNLENINYQTDTVITANELLRPYKRRAYAFKLGIGNASNYFDLNFFNAKDILHSTNIYPGYNPAKNTIIGFSSRFKIFKRISFNGNIAASFLTININAERIDSLLDLNNKILSNIIDLTGANITSRANLAGDAKISLDLKKFSIGLSYKRVDPLYTSFGAQYFYNDFENTTVNTSLKLLKSKIRLKGSYGLQRNNLSNLRSISNYRTIGSANIFVLANKHLSINARYSNYQNEQKNGFLILNDTLRLAQVNERFSVSPGYNFGNKEIKHSIRLTSSYQKFNFTNNPNITAKNNNIKSVFLNYSLKHKESKTGFKIGFNYNNTHYNTKDNTRFGISLGGKKQLLNKKLRLRLNTSFNKVYTNGQSDGNIFSARFSSNYTLDKKQKLTFNFSWMNKNTSLQKAYSQIRGRFSYSLTF